MSSVRQVLLDRSVRRVYNILTTHFKGSSYENRIYESDITPPLGGFMWGHYSPMFATDVEDSLYARAAVIEGEDGICAAFVTVDTCAPSPYDARYRHQTHF